MPYYVYIIYSLSRDKYYIGQTENIEQRVTQHRTGKNMGATDWEIKYKEKYDNRPDAVKREQQIKRKKSRNYIEYLLKQ